MHFRAILQAIAHHINPLVAGLVVCFSSLIVVGLYYRLKPIIPRSLRLAVRRALARWKLKSCESVWPIFEPAGKAPQGWGGWPEGARFAFVLTHDVESQQGIDRVRALAELEMSLGFRSLFNFIPEGSYRVSTELRNWLTNHGFEVGVHDHRHDGKLYWSRNRFQASAARINYFLKEWNAVGFRSGFMLRNLNWIQDLEILYDASTFDTDPFEPQPEGAHTIFPFWISGNDRQGYVELPYTLAQDFSLFIVLQERTTELWKKKLDWIALRGGMSMMNVHPDYTALHSTSVGKYEYPLALYKEFLEHVMKKFSGQYWHALPKEVAEFYCKATGRKPRQNPRMFAVASGKPVPQPQENVLQPGAQ